MNVPATVRLTGARLRDATGGTWSYGRDTTTGRFGYMFDADLFHGIVNPRSASQVEELWGPIKRVV